MRYAPVTRAEWEEARLGLHRAVDGSRGTLVIGRALPRNGRMLQQRYAASGQIDFFWFGPAPKVATMERVMQAYACVAFGRRVANRNLGGGKGGSDETEGVYVAIYRELMSTAPDVNSVVGGVRRKLRRGREAPCRAVRRRR